MSLVGPGLGITLLTEASRRGPFRRAWFIARYATGRSRRASDIRHTGVRTTRTPPWRAS